jgi:hypothetical protein
MFGTNTYAALTDIKFGQYQIADSQWNVNACLNTTTCEIYSKNPGVAYKIPWTNGQVVWAAGDYVKFDLSGNGSFPYTAKQYDSAGNVKSTLGDGKIVNMGPDYFFFVGSDNNTGQLFSGSSGMSNTSGVSWTGTLNPTIAEANAYANSNYSTEPLTAGQTAAPAAPSLCCGGSSNSFNATVNNTSKVQIFVSRSTQDSQVYIEQLGNQNIVTVNQTGTQNNYTKYYGNGSSNIISITQSGNNNTQANYVDVSIVGNSNNVNLQQQSTGGGKGIFATVNNNSNTLLVQQKDSGSHYTDVGLFGGNKNVDILQQGSADHMAKVTLSGTPTDLSLSQSGATQNFYSINFNCATQGGCAKITVQQGN